MSFDKQLYVIVLITFYQDIIGMWLFYATVINWITVIGVCGIYNQASMQLSKMNYWCLWRPFFQICTTCMLCFMFMPLYAFFLLITAFILFI